MSRRASVIVWATTMVFLALSATPAIAAEPAAVSRVLVLSLPGVTYEDLNLSELPNISGLLDDSAIANMSVRGVRRRPTLSDGYVTIGAGARAIGRSVNEGQCLASAETFEGGRAGDAMARRSGLPVGAVPADAVVCLAQPAIVDRNDELLYDAEAGLLGDTLAEAGIHRAVIGNADRALPAGTDGYARAVGLALAGHDGIVSGGQVTQDLLAPDPEGPFGLRERRDAFVRAFEANWSARSVVLVEASDLVRFDDYLGVVADDAEMALKRLLLRDFDALVGELLARVDERDAVMIVGPAHLAGGARLMMATLRAPGVEPGLLSSSYTRRSGLVSIVDVGPTILDVLGIAPPSAMEGRPFEASANDNGTTERVSDLIEVNDASRFRDRVRNGVTSWTVTFEITIVVLALAASLFVPRARRALEFAALAFLAFLPATFLARLAPFHDWGVWPYWVFLVGAALLIAGVIWSTTDRTGLTTLTASLAVIVAVLALDCLSGSHLQYNSPFGYSATIAGRFAGIGNLGYAQLSVATLLLSALIVAGLGPERGRPIALALMGFAIVIDGAPFWGADVGGVLSMVPAYALCASMLFGWRFRWRMLALFAAVAVALLGVFAAIDASRPDDQKTHLGRLVDATSSGGWDAFSTVILRKISLNLDALTSVWMFTLPIVLAFVVALVYRTPGRLAGLFDAMPSLRPAVFGLVVLAGLGFALNDSGIAVPGMMMCVVAPAFVILVSRLGARPPAIVWRRPAEPAEPEPLTVRTSEAPRPHRAASARSEGAI